MNVRDLMTTDVVVVHPETPLKQVAHLLVDHRISGVPVVDIDRRLVGILTEADFLMKEASGQATRQRRSPLQWLLGGDRETRAARQRIDAVTAGEAMSTPVASIGPDRPLSEAARRMTDERVNRLPVVEGGRLVGILSRADIVRAYARTDDDLFVAARDAVRAVDGLRVVAVEEGVVRIAGSVSHRAVAAASREVIATIDGVVGVDDRDVSWQEETTSIPVPGWSGDEPGTRPGPRRG